MLRRHLLAALAAGIAAGSDDVARAELSRIDWVLRGRARRRLEHALIDAALATGVLRDDDPDDTRHLLRAAALVVLATPCDLADRARVAAAYAAAPRRPAPRLPLATGLAALAALALAAAAVTAVVAIAVAPVPDAAYTRPTPPPPVGAFRHGGAPARDPALEPLLLELARLATPSPLPLADRRRALAALRAPPALAARPALAAAWAALGDELAQWFTLAPSARGRGRAARELRARVEVLSDQLAAAGLGYYLDTDLLSWQSRHGDTTSAYLIERVAFVEAGDRRVRVLDLRRLDPSDADASLLGLKQEALADPIVLLDAVDDKLTHQLLPVLAGHPFHLGDLAQRSALGRDASRAAGAAIRRELVTALGSRLDSEPLTLAHCRRLVAESIRHHEAQHALDVGAGLVTPAALAPHILDRPDNPFAVRARFELSAYLSQIASDMWLPQLTLWSLLRHAFSASPTPSEEALVAVIAVEALARRLSLTTDGPLIHNGDIDHERLAALAIPLADRSTTELRSAAAAAWADLFERRLVRLVDRTGGAPAPPAEPAGSPPHRLAALADP